MLDYNNTDSRKTSRWSRPARAKNDDGAPGKGPRSAKTLPRTTAQMPSAQRSGNHDPDTVIAEASTANDNQGPVETESGPKSLDWFYGTVQQSRETLLSAEGMLARYETIRTAIHYEYADWFQGAARREIMPEFESFEAEFLSRCYSIVLAQEVETDDIRAQVAFSRTQNDLIESLYDNSAADVERNGTVAALERAGESWEAACEGLRSQMDYNLEAAKHLGWVETTLARGRETFSTDVRHAGVELDPIVDAAMATMLQTVTAFLEKKLGTGGARLTRSSELRSFRKRMKDASRDQARTDIDNIIRPDSPDQEVTAKEDYAAMDAKPRIYKTAKGSVDNRMRELAAEQALKIVGPKRAELEAAGNEAAFNALDDGIEAATAAAREAVKETARVLTAEAIAEARTYKNTLIKNPDSDEMESMQVAEEAKVRTQTTSDAVGQKALEQSIEANTTEQGLSKVGKLLDSVLSQPGDSATLKIGLKIPLGQTPGYLSLSLEGTAARGTDGAVTAGVPVLSDNPQHLESQVTFTIGGGAEFFGLSADGSVGFFIRCAGKDTQTAMQAMNYGAYRSACRISSSLGNWWAGSNKGTGVTRRHKAEAWAAMIEEDAFAEDDGAFVHQGINGGVTVGADFCVASGEVSAGGARFRKWDKASLEQNLGEDFAKPVANDQAAKSRRERATGSPGMSVGASVSVSTNILGQGVDFSASLSGSATDFRNNWGVEITSGISLPPEADQTTFALMAAGIVGGALSAAQALNAVIKGKPGAGGVDLVADITTIVNAGLETQLTTYLAELAVAEREVSCGEESVTPVLGVSSGVQVAMLFGKGDGQGIFRVELRSGKTAEVKVGVGNVGLSGSVERNKRLAAFGYDTGHLRAEMLGEHLA